MAKKSITTLGIDHDPQSIRATLLKKSPVGNEIFFDLEQVVEIPGNFESDTQLIDGLKELKSKLSISGSFQTVTCISGKQIYAAQMQFRNLPHEDMRNALRFELRKAIPFETAGSVIEFQYITPPEKKAENVEILVTVVAAPLMKSHLAVFNKVGFKPDIVDILPTAIANVCWSNRTGALEPGAAHITLHIGHTVCTTVFDGDNVPFFTRPIPFESGVIFGNSGTGVSDQDRKFKFDNCMDEVMRTISFYTKTYKVAKVSALHLIGEYIFHPQISAVFQKTLELPLMPNMDLKKYGYTAEAQKGKFDVALALALREE